MKRFTFFSAVAFFVLISTVWADVPKLINFQSLLTTSAGDTVANGNYTITFRIYNVSSGGSPLWTEPQTVTTSGGLFSVLLGAVTPLPASVLDGTARYLSIQVAPDPEMLSRTRLVSVPYAYFALRTDTANLALNVAGGPFLPLSGGTMSGPITNSGNPSITMGKGNFGSANTNSGTNAFVAGQNNNASGSTSTVGGGLNNNANNIYAVVGGGANNTASGGTSVVSGGFNNKARGNFSVVSGGGGSDFDSNSAVGDYSVIGGGRENRANGNSSVIGGGRNNYIPSGSDFATVSGGDINFASGSFSTIGGGWLNVASGNSSTVGGGGLNIASGLHATVSGGEYDTASGGYSVVPGGVGNRAAGSFSFAAGSHARALHDHTFVWSSYESPSYIESTAPNQFLVHAPGGVGIGTNSPGAQLEVNGNVRLYDRNPIEFLGPGETIRYDNATISGIHGMLFMAHPSRAYIFGNFDGSAFTGTRMIIGGDGKVGIGTTSPSALLHVNGSAGNNTGVWSNLSDRRLKIDIQPIERALETVEQLQPVTFRWKDSEKDSQFGRVRGLIAQDVEKVIPEWVKTDPDGYKRLEPIGIDALLIEAIKEQQKTIEELKDRIEKLEKKNRQARIEN